MADLPLAKAEWLVSTVPLYVVGVSYEDPRLTLVQLARTSGFRGDLVVTSHHRSEVAALISAGADLVLEPFQDAADRAVELISGSPQQARFQIPLIESEEQQSV